MMKTKEMAAASLCELQEIIENMDWAKIEELEGEILNANRIFVTAAGRSFLAMKFFAMRLMQLGFQTYLVGEVCTPSIQRNDLLIVGSGSGETPSICSICRKAKDQGARIGLFTKMETSTIASMSNCFVVLNTDPSIREGAMTPEGWIEDDYKSIRSSGNPFEQSIVIVSDALICDLMQKLGRGVCQIKALHANLE